MTWFSFPQKKLVLNCYTSRPEVFNYAPIEKATAFLPDWWKNLPASLPSDNSLFPNVTMKSCVGFSDLYKKGAILPMWSDVNIKSIATRLVFGKKYITNKRILKERGCPFHYKTGE